jgi:hypothetical protein
VRCGCGAWGGRWVSRITQYLHYSMISTIEQKGNLGRIWRERPTSPSERPACHLLRYILTRELTSHQPPASRSIYQAHFFILLSNILFNDCRKENDLIILLLHAILTYITGAHWSILVNVVDWKLGGCNPVFEW